MKSATITSVVSDDNPMRCITASVSATSGHSSLIVRGVTDTASEEIRKLLLDAIQRRGINLPKGAIAIELDFDIPFEKTTELTFTAITALLFAKEQD